VLWEAQSQAKYRYSSKIKHSALSHFLGWLCYCPGRLKNRSGWKKTSVGALVTCGKRSTIVTWSEHWKIYCRVIVTQAKNRTWANCAVALSVSEASRSRLCPDGPRVQLSGPAYMSSCIGPGGRPPLDQHALCSDCCKKCTMSGPSSLPSFCSE